MIYNLSIDDFNSGTFVGTKVKVLDIAPASKWFPYRSQFIGKVVILDSQGFVLPKAEVIQGPARKFTRTKIGCCYLTCCPVEDDPDDNY